MNEGNQGTLTIREDAELVHRIEFLVSGRGRSVTTHTETCDEHHRSACKGVLASPDFGWYHRGRYDYPKPPSHLSFVAFFHFRYKQRRPGSAWASPPDGAARGAPARRQERTHAQAGRSSGAGRTDC